MGPDDQRGSEGGHQDHNSSQSATNASEPTKTHNPNMTQQQIKEEMEQIPHRARYSTSNNDKTPNDLDDNENDKNSSNNSNELSGGDDTKKGSFRRAKSRASRACEICHSRKVRCDVMERMPCTNCAAFGCECRIPEVRQRKGSKLAKAKQQVSGGSKHLSVGGGSSSGAGTGNLNLSAASAPDNVSAVSALPADVGGDQIGGGAGGGSQGSNGQGSDDRDSRATTAAWKRMLDTRIQQPGRVSFMGSTSHLNLILENMPDSEAYYFAAVGESSLGLSRIKQMDREDIDVLKLRGAFLLPAQELCDDLIESYFEKVHPVVPIVNRTQFMRQYNDPANPPSLLLRQAMLVAASRTCNNSALLDERGSSKLATATFYKRAKALFDANYEMDRVPVIQSAILLAWFLEGPDDVTANGYYWTRIAVTVAQGIGLHRNMEKSGLPEIEKRIWKRIWWTLFTRDRSTAVAMGRPVMINLDDADVPMITLEDFDESEPGSPSPYKVNRGQALYFIYSVKLSEIMGLTIKEHYSIGAENIRRHNRVPDVSQCDMAMATWMNSLPQELKYSLKDRRNHDFFKALLHCQYYTVLCLVHRSNIIYQRPSQGRSDAPGMTMPLNPANVMASGRSENINPNGMEEERIPSYPSWGIAFQAAHMIVRIAENLDAFNELTQCPAIIVYTVFSAMILLIYQMESPSEAVVESAKRAVISCRNLLDKLGKVWDTADRICKLASYLAADPRIREKVVRSAKRYAEESTAPLGTGHEFSAGANNDGQSASKRSYADMLSGGKPNALSQQEITPNDALGPAAAYASGINDNSQQERTPSQPPRSNITNNNNNNNPSSTLQQTYNVPSELFLVTNADPPAAEDAGIHAHQTTFQPAQLFPDSLKRADSNLDSNPNSTGVPSTGASDPPMFTAFDSFGEQLGEKSSASPANSDDMHSIPNTLNLGDWYKFLMTNTNYSEASASFMKGDSL